MNQQNTNEGFDRDTLLLETLMGIIPNAGLLNGTRQILETNGAEPVIIDMLKGYGTLLNIIQAATELEGSLYDRLSLGYYELTNNDYSED
jgi:hypothetical protein